jgi:hypothetical protein
MVTAMLMVYLNLSKSASLPLGLLGRLDQRVHPLDGPMNGGVCGNLAVPARYVGRFVEIHAGELASPQPAKVDDGGRAGVRCLIGEF